MIATVDHVPHNFVAKRAMGWRLALAGLVHFFRQHAAHLASRGTDAHVGRVFTEFLQGTIR